MSLDLSPIVDVREFQLSGTTSSGGALTILSPELNGDSVLRISINYPAAPAGCDITITDDGTPALTILTLTDNNADGVWSPLLPVHTVAGVAISDVYQRPYIGFGKVKFVIGTGGDTLLYQIRLLVGKGYHLLH